MKSNLVVDLSHWNTVTDFAAMKAAGVIGVILKCTESTDYVDPTYASRRESAQAAGLLVGAYHFLHPGSMKAQAAHFVDKAGKLDGLLLAADHENAQVSLTDLKTFLKEVTHLVGNPPIIYSGHVLKEQLHNDYDAELAQYRLWLAHYTSGSPSWPSDTWDTWWLWQHTDKGTIAGVSGNVDLNNYSGDDAKQLADEWDQSPLAPPILEPETEIIVVTIRVSIEAPKGSVISVAVGDEP